MNKRQLIEAISEDTSFSRRDVLLVLSSLTRIIEKTLKKGGKVSITSFGTYTLSSRPKRIGINPSTKQKIQLPAISLVRFKAGKHLREQLKSVKISNH